MPKMQDLIVHILCYLELKDRRRSIDVKLYLSSLITKQKGQAAL
jgi:hypothetical protein